MAQIWLREKPSSGAWIPLFLKNSTVLHLDEGVIRSRADDDGHCAVVIRRGHRAAAEHWVLLAADYAGVKVNGIELFTGIHVLREHDAVHLYGSGPVFFSTERLAAIKNFTGTDQTVFCPRCKLPVQGGNAAVQCPQCRSWHHTSEERPCWGYAEHCALCSQPTALDAGYRWTPGAI